MRIYLAAEQPDSGLRALGFPIAQLGVEFTSLPAPRSDPLLRGGACIAGGCVQSRRAAELIELCRRQGQTALLFGFSGGSQLELLRFCEALVRRGILPILPEAHWQAGCAAAALVSTAVSGGTLSERIVEAQRRYGEIVLDLERTRRVFTLPSPEGEGAPLDAAGLEALRKLGGESFFSGELMCKAFATLGEPKPRMVLYDDGETLRRKAALAASLGVRRAFVLASEWTLEELGSLRKLPDAPL